MPYVSVTSEQFIDYFANFFKDDIYGFLKEYLNGKGCLSNSDNKYIVHYPMNNSLVLTYSKIDGLTETSPENANLFVTSVYYMSLMYYALEQYTDYSYIDNKWTKSSDYPSRLSNLLNLPLLVIGDNFIMSPTHILDQLGFHYVGKHTALSMMETMNKTRDSFIEMFRYCLERLNFDFKTDKEHIFFMTDKMIDIEMNKLQILSK